MSMTEEQELYLQSLEKEFENRYTELDEEFKAVLNARPSTPPIIENYFESFDQRERYHGNRPYRYNSSFRENRFRIRGYDYYNSRGRHFEAQDKIVMNERDRSPNRFRNRREYAEHYSSHSPCESIDYSQDY